MVKFMLFEVNLPLSYVKNATYFVCVQVSNSPLCRLRAFSRFFCLHRKEYLI